MAIPLESLQTELERIFRVANKGLFEGFLQMPSFVLQPEKKVILRFDSGPNQMVIGKYFAVATVSEIYESMLHEMIHIQNQGEKSNAYHNKKFLLAALNIGLYVSYHPKRGWCLTKLVEEEGARSPNRLVLNHRCKVLEKAKFDLHLLEAGQADLRKMIKTPKVCFLKYVCKCPPPYNSFRSGRRPGGAHPPRVRCENCNSLFVCQD